MSRFTSPSVDSLYSAAIVKMKRLAVIDWLTIRLMEYAHERAHSGKFPIVAWMVAIWVKEDHPAALLREAGLSPQFITSSAMGRAPKPGVYYEIKFYPEEAASLTAKELILKVYHEPANPEVLSVYHQLSGISKIAREQSSALCEFIEKPLDAGSPIPLAMRGYDYLLTQIQQFEDGLPLVIRKEFFQLHQEVHRIESRSDR